MNKFQFIGFLFGAFMLWIMLSAIICSFYNDANIYESAAKDKLPIQIYHDLNMEGEQNGTK